MNGFGPRGGVRVSGGVRAGFTLIEVLIAIAIVLALGAVVGVAVLQRQDSAKIDLAKTQLNQIQKALDMFYVDFGRYPTDEEGLAVLWNREVLDPDADAAKWVGYLTTPLPRDIWGNDWGYRGEEPEHGEKYDLWSNGPDGQEDTEDDLTSWAALGDEIGDEFAPSTPRRP